MADYVTTLKNKQAQIPAYVKTAQTFRNNYGALVKKYRGGMPYGFLLAIAAVESGGKMVAGDASLGEYGFFQIGTYAEDEFGVPRDTRKSPEGNCFLAGLEYNVSACRLHLRYPSIINGSLDQWLMARLVFAIGIGATYKLIEAAREKGFISRGMVYKGVSNYLDAAGVADKRWYRTKMVGVTAKIGTQLSTDFAGYPVEVPAYVPYTLPKAVQGKMKNGNLLALAAMGIALAV